MTFPRPHRTSTDPDAIALREGLERLRRQRRKAYVRGEADVVNSINTNIDRLKEAANHQGVRAAACETLGVAMRTAGVAVLCAPGKGSTTLLAALRWPDGVEISMIGDGAVVVARGDLSAAHAVFLPQHRRGGELATALGPLSSPRPASIFLPHECYPDGLVVALATDGVTGDKGLALAIIVDILVQARAAYLAKTPMRPVVEGALGKLTEPDNRSVAFFATRPATQSWGVDEDELGPFASSCEHPGGAEHLQDRATHQVRGLAVLAAVADGVGGCGSPAAENASKAAVAALEIWFARTFAGDGAPS